jgi:ABC-type Fe3+ transport system substrate-binding protein
MMRSSADILEYSGPLLWDGSGIDPRRLDFLGTVPVPVRQRVRDGAAEIVAQSIARGALIRGAMPMGQGGRTPFAQLRYIRNPAEYPAMLVSAEHGNIFNRRFYAAHVATGGFSGCQPLDVAAAFRNGGLVDPRGIIGVFAVAPFVMLIDKPRLNGLPVPKRWRDLIEPEYRGQVVFGGWRKAGENRYRSYNKFFLLCMAEAFGLNAVAALVKNVPCLMHSAQMPRYAGSNMSTGGIYVLPWSLADLCPRRAVTEMVWPEDGAFAYPLWLTVKRDRQADIACLIEYFYGSALADYLDANRYPALGRGTAALPPDAALRWPGWDFIRHPATAKLLRQACDAFESACGTEEIRSCA